MAEGPRSPPGGALCPPLPLLSVCLSPWPPLLHTRRSPGLQAPPSLSTQGLPMAPCPQGAPSSWSQAALCPPHSSRWWAFPRVTGHQPPSLHAPCPAAWWPLLRTCRPAQHHCTVRCLGDLDWPHHAPRPPSAGSCTASPNPSFQVLDPNPSASWTLHRRAPSWTRMSPALAGCSCWGALSPSRAGEPRPLCTSLPPPRSAAPLTGLPAPAPQHLLL